MFGNLMMLSGMPTVHTTDIISVNTENYNLLDEKFGGVAPASAVQVWVTIASGIHVYSNTTALPAMDLSGLPAGSVINLINLGYALGMGGQGGEGDSGSAYEIAGVCYPTVFGGTAGYDGGDAVVCDGDVTLSITNVDGLLYGGGGGGGGGGGCVPAQTACATGAGGGGGGGSGGFPSMDRGQLTNPFYTSSAGAYDYVAGTDAKYVSVRHVAHGLSVDCRVIFDSFDAPIDGITVNSANGWLVKKITDNDNYILYFDQAATGTTAGAGGSGNYFVPGQWADLGEGGVSTYSETFPETEYEDHCEADSGYYGFGGIYGVRDAGSMVDPFYTDTGGLYDFNYYWNELTEVWDKGTDAKYVNVHHVNHECTVGTHVIFDSFDIFANFDPNKTYEVLYVDDDDNYVIKAAAAADTTTTGGGGTGNYEYPGRDHGDGCGENCGESPLILTGGHAGGDGGWYGDDGDTTPDVVEADFEEFDPFWETDGHLGGSAGYSVKHTGIGSVVYVSGGVDGTDIEGPTD